MKPDARKNTHDIDAAPITGRNKVTQILRLDASANPGSSTSFELGHRIQERLQMKYGYCEVRQRDLNEIPGFIDSSWIAANFSTAESRDAAAKQRLALSDALIAELQWADHILVTTPMYNFSVPASLKAWIDQVCRAGITFRYTADGPQGLLEGKRVDIVISTGGTPLDSPADFASGYLRQIFRFIGIEDISIFAAERMNMDSAESRAQAVAQIDAHYPATAA